MCAELFEPLALFVPGAADVCGGGGRVAAVEVGVASVIVARFKKTETKREGVCEERRRL